MSACTYNREPAVQDWPWLKKMPSNAAAATTAGSASGSTMCGDFPPSSSETFFMLPVAAVVICRPTSVEPVKATLSTPGWAAMAAPTTLPGPVTTLSTPGGNPTACTNSARRRLDSVVSSAALSTTVFAIASAVASFEEAIDIGKFQGTIAPTTPIGSCTV